MSQHPADPATCVCRGVKLGCQECVKRHAALTGAAPQQAAAPEVPQDLERLRVLINRPGLPAGRAFGGDQDGRTFVRFDSGCTAWVPTLDLLPWPPEIVDPDATPTARLLHAMGVQ